LTEYLGHLLVESAGISALLKNLEPQVFNLLSGRQLCLFNLHLLLLCLLLQEVDGCLKLSDIILLILKVTLYLEQFFSHVFSLLLDLFTQGVLEFHKLLVLPSLGLCLPLESSVVVSDLGLVCPHLFLNEFQVTVHDAHFVQHLLLRQLCVLLHLSDCEQQLVLSICLLNQLLKVEVELFKTLVKSILASMDVSVLGIHITTTLNTGFSQLHNDPSDSGFELEPVQLVACFLSVPLSLQDFHWVVIWSFLRARMLLKSGIDGSPFRCF
jgi:hypothetical protein